MSRTMQVQSPKEFNCSLSESYDDLNPSCLHMINQDLKRGSFDDQIPFMHHLLNSLIRASDLHNTEENQIPTAK